MKRKRTDCLLIAQDRNEMRFTTAIVFLCGAILTLRLISSFFPKERLWGINHLAYFSPYFAVGITILGLLVLIPKMNYWLQDNLRRPLNLIHELTIKRHKCLYFIVFSFLSVIGFWFLRVRTHFLGDEYLLITGLSTGKLALKWSEPLEIAAHLYLYRFLKQFVAVNGAIIYSLISYIAGVIFVFFGLLTADLLGKNKFEKVFVFGILVSMGSILLFMGYAEHYSLTYATILGYLYFSLSYLKGKSSILPATLIFMLSCSLHLLAFSFFPSFVFLCLLKSDAKTGIMNISKKRAFIFIVLSLFVVAGIYIYVRAYGGYTSLLPMTVPFFSAQSNGYFSTIFAPSKILDYNATPYYTILSFSHLLDMINEQLLISPVGLILLVSTIIFALSRAKLKDKVFQFLVLVMFFQLSFHLLIDPEVSAVRDWDLFSFSALGCTLLGVYLFLKKTQRVQRIRYVGTVLVFTSLFSTLPWVMLNASTDKSLKRIFNAVELDPSRYASFYLDIQDYLKKIGASELDENKRIEELFEVNFTLAWLDAKGREHLKNGDLEGAETAFKEALRFTPWRPSVHYNLGILYSERGKLDEAILEYEKAVQMNPEDIMASESCARLGEIYVQRTEFDKAIGAYEKAIKGEIDDKELAYQSLGHCYLIKNELDKAISMYQKGLKLNPDVMEPHVYLGHAYRKKGMKDKAVEEYKVYLKYGKDPEEIKTIKALILELEQKQSNI